MDRIGIGLVGCGEIARRRYLPLLEKRSDAAITAVCTSNAATARAAAARLGAEVFATAELDALLRRSDVDAVIVSTPHRLHARQAAAALEAGKHVLVEKPMATSWQDAELLIGAARRAPQVAMILPFEHNAELLALGTCLEPGVLGRIVAVSADFSGPGAPPGRGWKYSLEASGGGVIVAHAVYALDLIASVMGPARKVTAFANTFIGRRISLGGKTVPVDIEDNAVISLEYATGQLAVVRSSWAYPHKQRNLVIQGTRRCVCMAAGGVYLAPPAPGRSAPGAAGGAVLFSNQDVARVPVPRGTEDIVEHFLRCIRTGTRPQAGIEQAAHVTEQMMQAYESVRSGTARPLSTTFTPRLTLPRELFTG